MLPLFNSFGKLEGYDMNRFQTALTGLVCIYLFILEPAICFADCYCS
jgi:hypothetical protein